MNALASSGTAQPALVPCRAENVEYNKVVCSATVYAQVPAHGRGKQPGSATGGAVRAVWVMRCS